MKRLRNGTITLFLLVLVCALFACGIRQESGNIDSNTVPKQEITIDVDNNIPVVSVDVSQVSTKETKLVKDVWNAVLISSDVPFTPEGYDGSVCNYIEDYTGEDGKTVQKNYTNVAFLIEDEADYGEDFRHWRNETIDGERVYGSFLFHREYRYFLEHVDGEAIERFYLDIKLPFNVYYPVLIDHNEEKALILLGSCLLTYRFDSKECNVISDSVLDCSYSEGEAIYFTDWNHTEHKCEWLNSDEVTETGNTVISYRVNVIQPEKNDDFQQEFIEMQEAIKSGRANEDSYSDKYDISYSGGIFSAQNDEYQGNIHMPYAGFWSSGTIWSASGSCWNVGASDLTLYRYGDEVRGYQLDEGKWKIVEAYFNLKQKKDTAFVEYDVDEDSDGMITAEELDHAIIRLDVMLLNVEEKALYHIDTDGNSQKVAEDVQDYCEAYGELYWMDSELNAYELSWLEDNNSVLIGKDVVGISKHTDERAGFIVKPGDPRTNCTDEGFYLCTLYGREWLNQEESSGAWALEHNWNQ